MTRFFCTLFDSNYLLKGVAMLRSLSTHCPDAHVYVLCMDEQTRLILSKLGMDNVTLMDLAEVETDALIEAKAERTRAEYCWTLSPVLPSFVLDRFPSVDFITYIDADLLFYSSLDPLFAEIGDASIAIIEHRFTPRLKHLEVNGRFCVEWVSFRRDAEGLACLHRWRDQCVDWCFYRLEEDRMGDQKYLDRWPDDFRNLHILQHPGAGVAPWNYAQHIFATDGAGAITVDAAPLIFYHFHQFQMLDDGGFDRLSTFYTSEKREPEPVYAAYERALARTVAEVRRVSPGFAAGMKRRSGTRALRLVQRYLPRRLKEVLRPIFKR